MARVQEGEDHHSQHPCAESGSEEHQEPCGRIVKGRPGVLYRNYNDAGQGCYRETIYLLLWLETTILSQK